MALLRCALLDDYQHVALSSADWPRLAGRVEVRAIHHHLRTDDDVAGALSDCHIAVAMRERTPFSAARFERLRHLQLLVTTGMRNASIDLEAARARGITVCGTRSHLEPPAELTWALILALARHIVDEATAMRAGGRWQQTIGMDLHGRTLGLLGLGRIGSHVARIGRAFGMRVLAWSQHLTADRAAEVGAELAPSRDALLEASDIVSVHLVLSERTQGLIGASELRKMKRHAYLVNTSRAPIVDSDALADALRDGVIAGAALDVFDEEPLPHAHPLRTTPNLLCTPHLGYVTRANYAAFYGDALENIEAFLAGSTLRTL